MCDGCSTPKERKKGWNLKCQACCERALAASGMPPTLPSLAVLASVVNNHIAPRAVVPRRHSPLAPTFAAGQTGSTKIGRALYNGRLSLA